MADYFYTSLFCEKQVSDYTTQQQHYSGKFLAIFVVSKHFENYVTQNIDLNTMCDSFYSVLTKLRKPLICI